MGSVRELYKPDVCCQLFSFAFETRCGLEGELTSVAYPHASKVADRAWVRIFAELVINLSEMLEASTAVRMARLFVRPVLRAPQDRSKAVQPYPDGLSSTAPPQTVLCRHGAK